MNDKKFYVLMMSIFVFGFCFYLGLNLAARKPLWNDELYTQLATVSVKSYPELLLGRSSEGNITPLFYVIQKAVCDVAHYQAPLAWVKGQWRFQDYYSQILLRLAPIFFMALALALIFYYFARYYSFALGIYSLFISLSSFMVWSYWAEARPYALWFFLTSVQSIIFLLIVRAQGEQKLNWTMLQIVHFLLALSNVLSVIQISVVALLLWCNGHREWRRYVWLLVVPLSICFFYYTYSPKYKFWFKEGPLQLIAASMPKDRLFIIFAFAAYVWKNKFFADRILREAVSYLFFTVLMVMGFLGVCLMFKLTNGTGHEGFQISNRYFIALAPIGIMAVTLFSNYLVVAVPNKIMRMGLVILIGCWVGMRLFKSLAMAGAFPF